MTEKLSVRSIHGPLCGSGALCVTVSLDGVTARFHYVICWIPGPYARIESAVQLLAAYPSGSRPLLRVRMTVSNLKVEELRVFEQSGKMLLIMRWCSRFTIARMLITQSRDQRISNQF